MTTTAATKTTTTTKAAATQKLNPVPDFETFYHFESKGVSKHFEEGHSPQKNFFLVKKENFLSGKKSRDVVVLFIAVDRGH